MNETLIAEDLAFRFGDVPVVDGISLTAAKGEWLGIVGPNGSGKSTMLRMLARLIVPERGSVRLDGDDVRGMNTKSLARRMTMLAQANDPGLDMTVRELVRRGRHPHLKWYEECRGSHEEVVDWALAATKTEQLQHRKLGQLSGGERQRAWLAMSMAQTPELLLLDEPTTYLDIAHQLELMELIRKLNKERGVTVLMVIHDLNQAARYCDRIMAVKDGRIAALGTPVEVFRPDFFRNVFGVEAKIYDDAGVPVFMPSCIAAASE
ncbi:ABC transporter ATP-binding protein [Paenibacillus xanthanilyticus]|uniref:ABC transporter ATP-binding protein n=1 Tax=Paenibacillus xanthanilyticus TaxID=1783531 RepID=A0ABV8K7I8_9BACL